MCRYWKQSICYRGNSCLYDHKDVVSKNSDIENMAGKEMKKCDRCPKSSPNRYYCELCGKDFCPECIKGARYDDISGCNLFHKAIEIADKGCENISKMFETEKNQCSNNTNNVNVEEEITDMEIAKEKMCQCGKPNKEENFV